jgi:hypothetical protein
MIFEGFGSDRTFEANTVYHGGKCQRRVSFAVGRRFRRKGDFHGGSPIDLSAFLLRQVCKVVSRIAEPDELRQPLFSMRHGQA